MRDRLRIVSPTARTLGLSFVCYGYAFLVRLQASEGHVTVVGFELDEIGHIAGGASEDGAGLRDEVDDCWRWPGGKCPRRVRPVLTTRPCCRLDRSFRGRETRWDRQG